MNSQKDSIAVDVSTNSRLLARSCESLLGIAAGLIADGELNKIEVQYLSTWLADHPELSDSWPGEVVYKRVREALADGFLTAEELAYLQLTLQELVGGSFSEDGTVPTGANALPIDRSVDVGIPDRTFCFTGKFLYGTRNACERAVLARGGQLSSVQVALSFLVIGSLSSRDWKFSSHGTKIESAMRLKEAGSQIRIVSEDQWIAAL